MLAEIKTKLMELLEGDAVLTPLLAAATAIYHRRPPKSRVLPCLTYSLVGKPDAALDTRGKRTLQLWIDIWSTSADANDDILAALDDVLYDAHRQGGMDTTNVLVKACRRVGVEPIPEDTADADTGEELERLRTEWTLLVYNKNL